MKILLGSSEVFPYSKTGGLADMVGSLAKTLARAGHEVGVITPLYAGVRERYPQLHRADLRLDLPLGMNRAQGELWQMSPAERLTVYFVDQPRFYQRTGIYQEHGTDYGDNAERFVFFSKAIFELATRFSWRPDVVHLHDWQTGFAGPMFMHARHAGSGNGVPRTCMTIHNLAYQGLFPGSQYVLTNLPWDYLSPTGAEFYGHFSGLKAGVVFADVLTTVSPRYAREILTPEYGCGFDGLLRFRQQLLTGILNGVDYEEWNPENDPHLAYGFSASEMEGKASNKRELQTEFGLPAEPEVPLFGCIGRLVEQKGVDLTLGALEEMLGSGIQFVLIGTGAPMFEKAFEALAQRFPRQVAVRIGFDEEVSHHIEAGCDFFLMPSRFEPCGLNQMYSLRYGTIPIARATGGLEDTVVDIRENEATANGIKFNEPSPQALAKAIRKALALYAEKDLLQHFRRNAMQADFSWERTMGEYLKVYAKAKGNGE
jgi:starch synthase